MPASTPQNWLLRFSSKTYGWTGTLAHGGGRPWGDDTAIAAREGSADPWDAGCKVTPLLGGRDAMDAVRTAFDAALADAAGLSLPDPKVHVYIADWRFNALRDVSTATDPWATPPAAHGADPTAIGYVLQLMEAGVEVRMLLWYPTLFEETVGSFGPHAEDHFYVAKLVEAQNQKLKSKFPNAARPLGIVALDARVAEPEPPAATHHQKMMVIRVGNTNVAFCGGVDLAFTRRDAPRTQGDWQSGEGIPDAAAGWPGKGGYDPKVRAASAPTHKQGTDLPEEIYGDGKTQRHIWHDQHLKLEGPIVATLEAQFAERWRDTGDVSAVGTTEQAGERTRRWFVGQVIFSTADAFDGSTKTIRKLPAPSPVPAIAGATTTVQMWRTIPWRARRGPPFERAELTAMAGIAHAVQQATDLIWIFDQYFWSVPLARLLNYQLRQRPTLHVILVLPPHADGDNVGPATKPNPSTVQVATHLARAHALDALTDGLGSAGQYQRVAVYNLWKSTATENRGIYCHAKAHTYDGSLFVCGSCNLNRRSLTCDSEIVCAVLDPSVVNAHQRALWDWLFSGRAWPKDGQGQDIDLTKAGSGTVFFNAFTNTVATQRSYLIRDEWWKGSYRLPNGILRDQDTKLLDVVYPTAMDPLALPVYPEDAVCRCRPGDPGATGRLDEIVFLLEGCYLELGGDVIWPYRRDWVADAFEVPI
jgi:phosphatidylserine/phosphatidylglycerophosphate/cardiolipin synthase-like enzyme